MNPAQKRLAGMFIIIAFLLSIPLIAMQFTPEVNWTLSDFGIAFILLSVTALLCELVWSHVKKSRNRLVLIGILLLTLFILWAEMAVGIFGSPIAGS